MRKTVAAAVCVTIFKKQKDEKFSSFLYLVIQVYRVIGVEKGEVTGFVICSKTFCRGF